MKKILAAAELHWKKTGDRNFKEILREEAQNWIAQELEGADPAGKYQKELLQKHF